MIKPEGYFKKNRPEVADFLPDIYTKVLEIGCGDGVFHTYLSEECEYWGIEPQKQASVAAAKILDKVLVGSFEDVYDSIPNDYFDLVICNDVIEHMVDHDKFYETIKSKVKNDAYMIGSLPNVRHIANLFELLYSKDWQYRDVGILDSTHLRFFTKKSMLRDFEKHGFFVEKFYGINAFKSSLKTLSDIKVKLFMLLLGEDTKFLQYAFRLKIK